MYLQRWSTHGCRYMQLSRAEVVEYCTESQRVTVKEVVPLPRPEIAPHLVIIREERVLEFFKSGTVRFKALATNVKYYCWFATAGASAFAVVVFIVVIVVVVGVVASWTRQNCRF